MIMLIMCSAARKRTTSRSPGATQLRNSASPDIADLQYRLHGAGLQPANDRPGAVLVPSPAMAAMPGVKTSAADRYSPAMQQTVRDFEHTDVR
jgi:hypothetical protein